MLGVNTVAGKTPEQVTTSVHAAAAMLESNISIEVL